MASIHHTLLLYCESSLHAGTGQGTGTIDLPIQRERHTGFPKIESSALRGAIREAINDGINRNKIANPDNKFTRIFGNDDNGDNRSAIEIGDARLLLFPVRSWKGVFAWITCPYVLERYQSDLECFGGAKLKLDGVPTIANDEVYETVAGALSHDNKVMFEEYLFTPKHTSVTVNNVELAKYLQKHFAESGTLSYLSTNIAIVSNEVFRDFVEMYTEKITRNKINSKTGTVDSENGGLFNEEFLPAESILYAYVGAANEFAKDNPLKAGDVSKYFVDALPTVFQVGGEANIGKGIVRKAIIKHN